MTLGLLTGGAASSIVPRVKWDARSGRMFLVERQQGMNGWESLDIEVPTKTRFAIDFGVTEVGWAAFTATGPDFDFAPLGAVMPARPSKDHKAGFKATLHGKDLGGKREFVATARSVLAAIDELHNRFEAAPEAAAGKVPVVELTGTTSVTTTGPSGKITSYAPKLEIVGWTDRLPEWGERTVPPPGAKAMPATKLAAPSNHTPPPAANGKVQAEDDAMPF